jgi:hypothetical protein
MSAALHASQARLEAALKKRLEVGVLRQCVAEVTEDAATERETVGPRAGLSVAPSHWEDEPKWIKLAEDAEDALRPAMLGLLGQLGGDLSARFIGEQLLSASGTEDRELLRAGVIALRNIGGVDAAIVLAKLASDERSEDELRRRAFRALEEIASFGSEQFAEGGLVSIDPEAVTFWERHRSRLQLWRPAQIIEDLDRVQGGEWGERASAVRGVILTRMHGELQGELERYSRPVLFVRHVLPRDSSSPSRLRDADHYAVFASHLAELDANPHWIRGRLPPERVACAVASRRYPDWKRLTDLAGTKVSDASLLRCRQLMDGEDTLLEAEALAFGNDQALELLANLAAHRIDLTRPVLLSGTAKARRNFVNCTFGGRAGGDIRELACSRWPRALFERYLAEVQRLRRATVFVDELEALSSPLQARLLDVVRAPQGRPSEAPLIVVGTSRTLVDLEEGHLLEPPVLDWLGTGFAISLAGE